MYATEKLVYTVDEAAQRLSIGRTLVYSLIASGQLRSIKIGGRRLISRRQLECFIKERESVA